MNRIKQIPFFSSASFLLSSRRSYSFPITSGPVHPPITNHKNGKEIIKIHTIHAKYITPNPSTQSEKQFISYFEATYGTLFSNYHQERVRLSQWPRMIGGTRHLVDGLSGGDNTTEGDFILQWNKNAHYACNTGVASGSYMFSWLTIGDALTAALAAVGGVTEKQLEHDDRLLYGDKGRPISDQYHSLSIHTLFKKLDVYHPILRAKVESLHKNQLVVERVNENSQSFSQSLSQSPPTPLTPTTISLNNAYFFTEINYHSCGSQLFYTTNGCMLFLLAHPGNNRHLDDIQCHDFEAFIVDAGVGVNLHPSVWHAPPIVVTKHDSNNNTSNQSTNHKKISPKTVEESSPSSLFTFSGEVTAQTRQSKVHSKIYYDPLQEMGTLLNVTLP